MIADLLYDLMLVAEKNKTEDKKIDISTVGQAMFVSDLIRGTKEYVSEDTDMEMYSKNKQETMKEIWEASELYGKYIEEIVKAFSFHDREYFKYVVEKVCKEEDDSENK